MAVAAGLLRSYGADSGARPAAGDDFDLVASAAEDSPRTACLRQLHRALTRMAESDWSGAAEAFAVAARIGNTVVDLDVLGNLGNAALQLGDDDAQRRFYAMELSRGREAGAVMAVIYALHRLCFGHLVAGDWVAVRTCAEEALAIAESIGARALTAPPLAWLTLLAALQGRDEYDDKLRVADQMTSAHPLGILTDPVHDLLRWAKAARAAGVNDSVDALHHLSRIRVPAIARMAATEALDVAVRAGEPETANGWTDAIAGFAVGTRRPWALATVSFGRAVTAAPTEAEAWYLDALRQQAEASRSVDRARIQLVYGEWLRRAQRRVDARQHLRAALAVFQDVRAEPLADRATQELRASGETARKRDPSTLVALTPMERQVAQLVASGLSNKDVAAHCWISPRTVAFHLRNVFAKAGITSRGELAGLDLG
jgi:DNA-binding CsgD family transcriptional regulator